METLFWVYKTIFDPCVKLPTRMNSLWTAQTTHLLLLYSTLLFELRCASWEHRRKQNRVNRSSDGNHDRASDGVCPIGPRIGTRHVHLARCVPRFERHREALLLAYPLEAQHSRWNAHRDTGRLGDGDSVPGWAADHIGHGSTDGNGGVEIGDGDRWIVEIGRRRWGLGAGEGGVHLCSDAGACKEQVVFVGGVVDEPRVRRMVGSYVTRPELQRPGSLACRIR